MRISDWSSDVCSSDLIVRNLETREGRAVVKHKLGRLWITMDDLRRGLPAAFRGTMVGAFLGILPGGGAMIPSFARPEERRVGKACVSKCSLRGSPST